MHAVLCSTDMVPHEFFHCIIMLMSIYLVTWRAKSQQEAIRKHYKSHQDGQRMVKDSQAYKKCTTINGSFALADASEGGACESRRASFFSSRR